MRVVRNSVFLIPYIRLHARRTKFSVLYHIFRLYARCMKLSVRHIILRFTFHSGCPRVVRNSVFLIPYIPFACVLHETPCFSYYIFRLYARRTKFSVSYTIYPTACASYEIQCLIPYIPTVCALHETQCSSYHTALYISFRLSARRTKFSISYTVYSVCLRVA